MSNQPLSPELRQLHDEICKAPQCAEHWGTPDEVCPWWIRIKRAHDLGVKAGLGKAAQVAEDLSQCNECGWFDDTATAIRRYIADPEPDHADDCPAIMAEFQDCTCGFDARRTAEQEPDHAD